MARNLTPHLNRNGTEQERFWRNVTILDNGCWLWTGGLNSHGYGRFYLSTPGHISRAVGAHCWVFTQHLGPIAKGLQLDHLCRNRACVNPLHLEPVTSRLNTLRGFNVCANNSRKIHCLRGHLLTGDNLRILPDGSRLCLACRKLTNARRYVPCDSHAKMHANSRDAET
jgi:hypothetical protein